MAGDLMDTIRALEGAVYALREAADKPASPADVTQAIAVLHLNASRSAETVEKLAEWLDENSEQLYSSHLGPQADAAEAVENAAARLRRHAEALREAESSGIGLAAALTQFTWRNRDEPPRLREVG